MGFLVKIFKVLASGESKNSGGGQSGRVQARRRSYLLCVSA